MDRTTPFILSLDTATPCSSVALTRGTREHGEILGALNLSGNVTHSRRLLASIDYLMNQSGVDWDDLDAVNVSLGPGSFTGLRIGMATAKGLAAAAGKPLIGVSTLDGLAAKCVTGRLVCAVLDARKKEVYGAFYRCDKKGRSARVSDMAVLSPQVLAQQINEPVLMVGDGAVAYKQKFKELLGDKLTIAPAHLHEPGASAIGMLAGEAYLREEMLDISRVQPIYIRSSDAELNLLKKKQQQSSYSGDNQ
ncbi:tRNA (adenosine(37)-N6)-threonylcarbamoyltransferase complex dimerization subunit type 1 TsaB [Desulforhopalus singaporensis]|uniref:N(6)-L-threonylcarbamoyladenine synthase n=1 Tax=Desulforhopalus singaporensis TaxID=91360 RepID=A0A1H0RD55_9BACT|nr:tRNA (adenosine(37)-N6)-threonylcarbamoyltransferase complex dimerization subunit type 1 TsaB [Desulforhopalus singaporensis]SDP27493.1 tRNA threonylcarbamoyladenosine biosynthesis protein TsaB [Desulforhopalus singaporensis]